MATTIVVTPPSNSTNTAPAAPIYTATIDSPIARTFAGSITAILNDIISPKRQCAISVLKAPE